MPITMPLNPIFNLATAIFIGSLITSFASASEPEAVSFPVDDILLQGDLSRPSGAGPFPAILWNHGGGAPRLGSDQYKVSAVLGEILASQGYVLLVPHRRGYGRSPQNKLTDRFRAEKSVEERNKLQLELMDVHMKDVAAAIKHLTTLPFVDTKRIIVAGCSFGGSLTLFAAEQNLPIKAAVNFAGAAISWRQSPELRDRMLNAARGARVPIFLIQAENDYTIEPSHVLAKELSRAGKPHQVKIYPTHGSTPQEGHAFCTTGADIWKSEVLSFIEKAAKQ
jgi:carboxymethylenebutenolidase